MIGGKAAHNAVISDDSRVRGGNKALGSPPKLARRTRQLIRALPSVSLRPQPAAAL
ncbi:hypothetical protein GRAQ_01256 [Rahnella aquatilis CIP 78.65 = ATCC 33071]|nr:hypothetical protein GRAQ_01256 [Rahnella aquatilis CIP 78.65 = ATCC 33071]